jgi:AcrR family transcriptional regulator
MQLSPAESRRRRQREEARRAILDATEALLLECGGDGLSIRRLAERCGYTAPTIYHYFGDKEGLVAALLEERFARLLASVEPLTLGPDPLDNLQRMVAAFLEFGEQNPTFHRLVLAGTGKGTDRTPPSAEAARVVLQRPWEELARAGRLHGEDPHAAAQSLWALLTGLTNLRVARPDFDWAPDLVDTAVQAMLRGLIKRAPSNGRASTC